MWHRLNIIHTLILVINEFEVQVSLLRLSFIDVSYVSLQVVKGISKTSDNDMEALYCGYLHQRI